MFGRSVRGHPVHHSASLDVPGNQASSPVLAMGDNALVTADATPAWFGKTPDRAVVDRAWVAVAEGALTREVVHEWTVPWVERTAERTDVMVYRGMTYLHGFDLVMSDPARPNLSRH